MNVLFSKTALCKICLVLRSYFIRHKVNCVKKKNKILKMFVKKKEKEKIINHTDAVNKVY